MSAEQPQLKDLILKHVQSNLPDAEIAKITGIGISTVSNTRRGAGFYHTQFPVLPEIDPPSEMDLNFLDGVSLGYPVKRVDWAHTHPYVEVCSERNPMKDGQLAEPFEWALLRATVGKWGAIEPGKESLKIYLDSVQFDRLRHPEDFITKNHLSDIDNYKAVMLGYFIARLVPSRTLSSKRPDMLQMLNDLYKEHFGDSLGSFRDKRPKNMSGEVTLGPKKPPKVLNNLMDIELISRISCMVDVIALAERSIRTGYIGTEGTGIVVDTRPKSLTARLITDWAQERPNELEVLRNHHQFQRRLAVAV